MIDLLLDFIFWLSKKMKQFDHWFNRIFGWFFKNGNK